MMTARRTPIRRLPLLACGLALLWATGTVLAQEPPQNNRPEPTKEQREKMAAAHEKFAACLRSDRPFADCHAEMMKDHNGMMMRGHPSTQPTGAPAQQ